MKRILFSSSLLAIFLFQAHANDRPDLVGLSQDESTYRKNLVDNVRYILNMDLTDPNKYTLNAKITFNVKKYSVSKSHPLTLDSVGGKLLAYNINGLAFTTDLAQKQNYISIPYEALAEGQNVIELSVTKTYTESAPAFIKFTDPEDKRIYVYSDLEPYKLNNIFPCFDQPDLKATFQLTTFAPKKWEIVANTLPAAKTVTNETAKWTFKESLPQSTYLFAIHAGEFKVWKSSAGNIPLRVLARQSIAKRVDPKEWFDTTKQGLGFYQKYFGYAYPFKKYDQIIEPDFLWGGMENIAAVTFSETYLKAGEKTRSQRIRLASVILHEMAHMWFGDLVTMSWWNDLWLNESFADYISGKAMETATPYKDTWITDTLADKPWAYEADLFSTTHPISAQVESTEVAGANFDGITYGKGAATLKMLNFLVGEDAFRSGLQNYFKKYAFKNTTLKDFLGALEETSGKDLRTWSSEWLETSGMNTVGVSISCGQDHKITSLNLSQKIPEMGDKIVRDQKTKVALFNQDPRSGKVLLTKVFDAEFRDNKEITEAHGLACPDLIQPNYQDIGFYNSDLDQKTIENLPGLLSRIEDNQSRGVFWINLWSMVQRGILPLEKFVLVVEQNIQREDNPDVGVNLGYSLVGLQNGSAATFVKKASPDLQTRLISTLEKYYWDSALKNKASKPAWKAWFLLYVHVAESTGTNNRLANILNETPESPFPGMIDQDVRWEILTRLSLLGYDVGELLEKEKQLDPSHSGQLAYENCKIQRPDIATKEQHLNRLLTDMTVTPGELDGIESAFPSNQGNIFASLMEKSYQTLTGSLKVRSDDYLKNLIPQTMPVVCTPEHLARAEKFLLDEKENMSPLALKFSMEQRDKIKTCTQSL